MLIVGPHPSAGPHSSARSSPKCSVSLGLALGSDALYLASGGIVTEAMKARRKREGVAGQACGTLPPKTGINFPISQVGKSCLKIVFIFYFTFPKVVGCFDGGENQHDVPSNLMAFLGAKSQSSRAPGCSWVLEGTLISQGFLF